MPTLAPEKPKEEVKEESQPLSISRKSVRGYPINILKVWIRRYISSSFEVKVDEDNYVFTSTEERVLSSISLMMSQVGEVGYPLRSTWAIEEHWKRYEHLAN